VEQIVENFILMQIPIQNRERNEYQTLSIDETIDLTRLIANFKILYPIDSPKSKLNKNRRFLNFCYEEKYFHNDGEIYITIEKNNNKIPSVLEKKIMIISNLINIDYEYIFNYIYDRFQNSEFEEEDLDFRYF